MTIFGLSILILMSVIFSVIGSIPGGPEFRLLLQKHEIYAMGFVIIMALVVNLVSALLGKALVGTDELRWEMMRLEAYSRRKQDIEMVKDSDFDAYHKRLRKIRWREGKIAQDISARRMRASCMTFIPMIALFFFIYNLFTVPTLTVQGGGFWLDVIPGGNVGVALTAMNAYPELNLLASYLFPTPDVMYWGSRGFISFTAFYFLCSFSLGTVIQRLFGLNTRGFGGLAGFGTFGKQDPSINFRTGTSR